MKKRISKLDELVQAIRTEAPVISFDEAKERIASLAEKRRKPFWFWLTDVWAFPIRRLQALLPMLAPPEKMYAQRYGALIHGFAGAVAALLVVGVFPTLIHDMQRSYTRAQPTNISAALTGSASTPERHIANVTQKKQHLSKAVQPSAMQPNIVQPSGVQQHPESIVETRLVEQIASSGITLTTLSSPEDKASNTLGDEQPTINVWTAQAKIFAAKSPSILERRSDYSSTRISPQNQWSLTDSSLAPEQTFWQRLSFEARMAARSDLNAEMATPVNTPRIANNSTPLQNLAMGMYYALSEHHSVGIEGGNEPFLTAVQFNSAAVVSTNTDSVRASLIGGPAGTGPSSTTTKANEYRQSPTNRTWIGAAYQYNADTFDIFGGLQPLVRITFGGGELGAVGRTLLRARFLSKERLSILLAGEGAAIGSQIQGSWNLTPRLGITLGLSVKF